MELPSSAASSPLAGRDVRHFPHPPGTRRAGAGTSRAPRGAVPRAVGNEQGATPNRDRAGERLNEYFELKTYCAASRKLIRHAGGRCASIAPRRAPMEG
ncbi:hypothetical protein WME90_16805 [Sorangium sp. So ce375]|uniref:hypothetical protein n=1 Tax=Sorangium sp. So ce375 TaxID=3133306 RepID=UPI003F5C0B36